MKKKKLILLSALAAASITTVAVTSSCKKDKDVDSTTTEQETETKTPATLKSISASGYSKVVLLGSNVEDIYKDAKVVATYSDGSTKDITDSVKWNTSNVVVDKDGKITKTGKYSITVKSGSYTDSFIVTVSDYSLESIEVDTTKADLSYTPYSSVNDFSSVVVYANYKNPVDGTINKVAVDSDLVSFVVTDKDNKVVDQVIAEGSYTVTVSALDKTATFTITCAKAETASSVASAVEQASKGEKAVNSGKYSYYNALSEYTVNKEYTFGKNYTKLVEQNLYSDGYEGSKTTSYFSVTSKGEAFAASVDEDGYVSKYYGDHLANVKDANAVGFDFFEEGGDEYPQYGFGNVIKALYEKYSECYSTDESVTKHESVGECAHIKDSEGKSVSGYNFDFNMIENASGAARFYHYSVEFVLNESGSVVNAYISKEKMAVPSDYENSLGYGYVTYDDVKNKEFSLPDNFGYSIVRGTDESGADIYSFVISSTATVEATDTYTVSQTSGEKLSDDTNPYAGSKVAVDSFKVSIVKSDGTEEEMVDGSSYSDDLDYATVTQEEGHRFEYTIKFSDITPDTANTSLDNIKVVVTGTAEDGTVVDGSWSYTKYGYARSVTSEGCTLQFGRAGTYTVTVSTLNISKSYTFTIADEAPTSIKALVSDGEATSDFAEVSSIDCYTTNTIYFNAGITSYFTQGYSATVLKLVGEEYVETTDVELVEGTYTVNGKEVKCYSFKSSVAGTYKVTLKGATPDNPEKSAATASILVNVAEVPSVDSIVKGDNNYLFEATITSSEMYKVKFGAPNESNIGSIEIWNKYDKNKEQVGTYTYADGKFTINTTTNTLGLADNAEFDILMTSYYKLKLVSATEETYALQTPTSDITDADWELLGKKYVATLDSTSYEFSFLQGKTKGNGSVKATIGSDTYEYSYTYDNESHNLVLEYNGTGNDPLSGLTLNVNSKITLTNGTTTVDLEKAPIKLSEFIIGTVSSTDESNSADYTFEFTSINDSTKTGTISVTRKSSSSKTGVYTYTFDDVNNTIAVTLSSGKNCYFNGFKISGETLYMINNLNVEYECSMTAKVVIPSTYVGTWYGLDSYDQSLVTVVISSDKVVVTGETANGSFSVQEVSDTTINCGNVVLTINSDGTLEFDYSHSYVTCSLSHTKPVTISVPEDICGTYSGYNEDASETQTVVIETNSITYGGYVYNLSDKTGNVYTFDDGTGYTVKISIADNGTITFTSDMDATFVITVPSQTLEFSESYIGTWVSTLYSVEITSTTLSVNGNEASNFAYDAENSIYTFDVVDSSSTTVSYELFFETSTSTNLTIRIQNDYRSSTDLTKDDGTTIVCLIGTFTYFNDDAAEEYTVTVTDSTITTSGDNDTQEYTISSTSDTEIIASVTDFMGTYYVKIYKDNGKVYFTTSTDGTTWEEEEECSKYTPSTPSTTTFTDAYIGTWTETAEDGAVTTVVITADSISVNNEIKNFLYVDNYGCYTIVLKDSANNDVTCYVELDGDNLEIYSSGYGVHYTLTKSTSNVD